jgi:lysophospholipase L1-like esterase
MINILCYGDSNTWGNIAGSRNAELMLAKRFDRGVRWTGVLQTLLGNDFYVIEAGLNGRNTSFDETRFSRPSRNGLKTLPLILEMNYPVDVVIFMLGTNDAVKDFKATPNQTTDAMQKMIRFVKECHLGQNFQAPNILLIAPAPIHKINSADFNTFFDDSSIAKTKELATHYARLAAEEGCSFLDAGQIVKVSDEDGVHIESESHKNLAKAIAKEVRKMISQST